MYYLRLLLFIPALIFPLLLAASDQVTDEMFQLFGDEIEEWEFRDDVVDIPPYPKKENLLRVQIDAPDAAFNYFVDPESIQVDADNVVVLVTSVIETRGGYQNIFFEGFRCDTREYITYAYGTGKKTFYEMSDPQWKAIKQRGGTGLDYRRDYVTVYLCDGARYALDRAEILSRIRFPGTIPGNSRGF